MKNYNLCIYYEYDSTPDEIILNEKQLQRFIETAPDNNVWVFDKQIIFADKVRSIEWWETEELH